MMVGEAQIHAETVLRHTFSNSMHTRASIDTRLNLEETKPS